MQPAKIAFAGNIPVAGLEVYFREGITADFYRPAWTHLPRPMALCTRGPFEFRVPGACSRRITSLFIASSSKICTLKCRGFLSRHASHAAVGFDSCWALIAGFTGFCALTETPIRGAGDDAINSHGIWSNANDYFGGQL